MDYIIGLSILIVTLILIANRSKYSLHMVQLEEYKSDNFKKWIENNKERAFGFKKDDQPVKKPLVFTQRATRLYIANLIISGVLIIIPILAFVTAKNSWMILLSLVVAFLVYKYQALTMLLANMVMVPFERRINQGFYDAAQGKIKASEELAVAGITGSFGKTSTKFIVGTILEEKYKVLNTPESYNTPMGLSKVINNELDESHEIFVAEMGAREIGEIKEVAELCQPKIGVITSIGPVHLETFKNIENIMKTKYELIEELPADGIAIFNYDNEYVKKLADKTFKEKILYGIEDVENLDVYADEIEVSELGSSFNLRDKKGNSIRCTTKLLGKHNIYNILARVCVAMSMGMTFEEIARGISKIQPVPHRLNLIDSGTGVIVIDDAFNSNPIGAKAALDVLSQFKEGRKIIVTPGMVELGAMEEEANREFGTNIGKVCDYAILIGKKRTKPIYEGLMEVNFNPDNVFVVNNLNEATERLASLTKPKDVVLFENDFPDNYNE